MISFASRVDTDQLGTPFPPCMLHRWIDRGTIQPPIVYKRLVFTSLFHDRLENEINPRHYNSLSRCITEIQTEWVHC